MSGSLETVVERFYSLNVGVVGRVGDRHERPHKPVLLLAVFDLIDSGVARPDRVPWSEALRERFAHYFALVRKHDDREAPELPFEHLSGDGFWQTYRVTARGEEPYYGEIRVRDSGTLFARFIDGVDAVVASPQHRDQLRAALIARYFPRAAAALQNSELPFELQETSTEMQSDIESDAGRSAGFRRTVVDAYDHQCAACGLRIRIAGADTSFVDAAHLIPFALSRNDHPTNGIALCKNHHWAMDRSLIAPTPDRCWRVSRLVISRRSTGEAELASLDARPLLPALDQAFAPDPDSLLWRYERLLA